ncbi:MAG: membrane protein insertion efficiency factor YidD [Coriobacteriia bacterium]
MRNPLASVALVGITVYRRLISPLLPPSCRFTPTCSAYSYTAIERYGIARGGWLALKRIARCHPWNPGGHDPVP